MGPRAARRQMQMEGITQQYGKWKAMFRMKVIRPEEPLKVSVCYIYSFLSCMHVGSNVTNLVGWFGQKPSASCMLCIDEATGWCAY